MSWLDEYAASLHQSLRERIAHDFPLLEQSHVEQLALFLVRDDVKPRVLTWWYLEDQLGSSVATQKFLDLYWETLARRYRSWRADKTRRGRQVGPRS